MLPGPRPAAEPSLPAALALLGLAWLAYAWPWVSGEVTIPWDAKNHFTPMLRFLAASLASGQSPDWSPYHFAGHPMIADPQSLIFSWPYRVLAGLVAVPTFRQQDAVELATLLLGGVGLVLFFREKGWGTAGGALAAVVFMFGGSASARLQHVGQILSYAAIPLALWAAARLARRGDPLSGLLLGLTGAMLAIGRDQVALLGCFLVVGFLTTELLGPDDRWRRLRAATLPSLLGGVLSLALLAVPLGLTVSFAAISNRPEVGLANAEIGSLHPAALLTMVVPDLFDARGFWADYWGPGSPDWMEPGTWLDRSLCELYAGVLPMVLLVWVGLARHRAFERDVGFFLVALVLGLLYALGRNTPGFAYAFAWVPGVDLFRRPADATFHLTLCLAILAGYCLHRHLADPGRGAPLLASLGVFAALTGLAAALAWSGAKLGGAAPALARAALLILAAHALLIAVARSRRPLAALALLALAAADVGWFNTASGLNAEPPSRYAELDPTAPEDPLASRLRTLLRSEDSARRDRVEILGLGGPWQNAPQALGLEATLGYNPLRWGVYKTATGAQDNAHFAARPYAPLLRTYNDPLVNLLGLRYVVAPLPIERIDPRLRPGDMRELEPVGEARIFENPDAFPRVFFARDAVRASFEAMLANGEWPAVDLRSTVVLDGPVIAPPRPAAFPSIVPRVAITDFRNTEVTVRVETDVAGHLVLNDLWNPWWRVEVDGEPAPLLRANVLFRAVALSPGPHVVRFRFMPVTSLIEGAQRWIEGGGGAGSPLPPRGGG